MGDGAEVVTGKAVMTDGADGAEVAARLGKEGVEDVYVEQQGCPDDEQDAERVDEPFGDHCSQGFGERDSVILREDAATRDLSQSGDNHVAGIGHEDGIDTVVHPGMFPHRFQRLPPPPSAQHMAQDTEKERDCHPEPVEVPQVIAHTGKVKVTVSTVEDGASQHEREYNLQAGI